MAVMSKDEYERRLREAVGEKIVLDISGPDGNAYMIMGYASKFMKQLGYSKEHQKLILDKMMSDNYEHLLSVFEQEFGDYVLIIG